MSTQWSRGASSPSHFLLPLLLIRFSAVVFVIVVAAVSVLPFLIAHCVPTCAVAVVTALCVVLAFLIDPR